MDREIGSLAARQHGVVTRAQVRSLGLGDSSISQRVAAGRLYRVHTGVYSVGAARLSQQSRWMAAVLAYAPDAVLSHHSAAVLWGLRFTATATIDVSVPRTGRRARGRIRVHRPRTLRRDETTTSDGIPVTTPARTILDLAALTSTRLEPLLDRNEILELTDYPALAALARAHPGHRGSRRLLAILDRYEAGRHLTRSDLERRFLDLCRDHGLPQPRVNTHVAGREVDFLFEADRLIVETDSWRYHKTRRAFENDRSRDALTTQAGYRTLRFTDRQLTTAPTRVADIVRATLASQIVQPLAPPEAPNGRRSEAGNA